MSTSYYIVSKRNVKETEALNKMIGEQLEYNVKQLEDFVDKHPDLRDIIEYRQDLMRSSTIFQPLPIYDREERFIGTRTASGFSWAGGYFGSDEIEALLNSNSDLAIHDEYGKEYSLAEFKLII